MRHGVVIASFACIGFSATPAAAIPSPELVVGTLSSVSQLFTLLAALLGGGALAAGASATRTSARGGGGGGGSKFTRWLGLGACAALALSIYGNWHQYSQTRDATRARLEATLLRPPGTPGQPRFDPALKELSFSQQTRHPLGISTADTAKAIEAVQAGDKETLIVDVRETAETAMGNLPGAVVARYPDFDDLKLDLAGKKVVMFCHNGNRSHETCEVLAARGIDCRFVVGGLEKWVTEARPMTGFSARTLDTLRAIPPYPAQRALLETAAVHTLVQESGAVFVDVRHAPEFKAGHLPKAINLPIRALMTAEVGRQIAALPKKPIVLPCYDRGGCFFAEVLGQELDKAGFDVRGRYTVPWEYFPPAPRPPHVEQWIEASQVGLWDQGVRATTAGFASLTAMLGLLGAIFAAALLSRLAVLPFSIKAERDQVVSNQIAPQIADLKQRLGTDPVRLARAVGALYRRHDLTPLRNMIALLFVPVLALFSVAVQRVSETVPTQLLWLDNIGQRDATFIMPLLAASVLGVYLHAAFVTSRRHALIVWLLAVPALASSLALLGAAVNVYIAVSAGLLLVQRVVTTGSGVVALKSAARALKPRAPVSGIVPLTAVDALQGAGNKAYRLAVLKAAGVNVPAGVVLDSAMLAQLRTQPDAWKKKQLRKAWNAVGSSEVAVRSSAAGEDGHADSFAGVFESVLHVKKDDFAAAVERVTQSFESTRAQSYGKEAGGANILVQRMVPARYAGVMFTRDPIAAGLVLVEMVEGTADGLVSGSRTPTAYRFGRSTGTLASVTSAKPPVDLTPLIEIGRRAEAMFACPQDIEWAFADGAFSIVQSRDIVSSSTGGDTSLVHAEWARVADTVAGRPVNDVAFVQNELTEVLPRPTTLSLSLMESFWSSGGSLDLACSRLAMAYPIEEDSPPYLATVLGHLYVDRREMTARSPVVSNLALRRLRRSADRIETDFREQFLPRFLAEMRVGDAIDFDRLGTADLLAELGRRRASFVEKTHVEVEVVNVLAQLYLDDARKQLAERKIDAIAHLVPHHPNELQRVMNAAREANSQSRLADLLAGMGHRSAQDYELARPRYSEDKVALGQLAEMPTGHGGAPAAKLHAPADVVAAVGRARCYQVLKEDAKHHALRELALLRRIVLAVDRRFDLEGLAFELTFAELADLDGAKRHGLTSLAAERQRRRQAFAVQASPASSLTPAAIELASAGGAIAPPVPDGKLGGTRVSGTGAVIGRARVIGALAAELGSPIDDFQQGDIIVARMINPAWLPYMRQAGGLVCEIGGWLSHTALVAREYGVVMVTGVRGIEAIADKARIELSPDGTIELHHDKVQRAAE